MSANQFRFYGMTTVQMTAATNTVVGVSAGPAVLDMVLTGFTGGLLYVAGASFNNGTMAAVGALVNTTALPLSLGVGSAYFTATGSSVVLSIMKKLSDGYNAQDVLTT